MLMLGYMLAEEGKGAVDYSWALLIAGLGIGAKFIGDFVMMLMRGKESAEQRSVRDVGAVSKEVDAARAETAKVRHDSLVLLINGIGEKLDHANKRMDQIEQRLNELAEEHHKLSLEFERHRAVHTEGKA